MSDEVEVAETKEVNELDEVVEAKPAPDYQHSDVCYIHHITGSDRIFKNYFSKKEFTAVVCYRADMISRGAPIYVEPKYTACEIAIDEILNNKCILALRRTRGIEYSPELKCNIKYVEIWNVSELKLTPKCISSFDMLANIKVANITEKIEALLK